MTILDLATTGGQGSALAETLARISALSPYLGARLLPSLEVGWRRVSDLLAAPDPAWLDDVLAGIMARYGLAERRTAATFFIGSYAWYAGAAAIAGYLAERRVPSLVLERVAVRFSTAGDEPQLQVALLDPGFAALADDPARADLATVSVSASREALREHLRQQIETHMDAMIAYISAHVRLSRRAQWNLVADACAEICLVVGQRLGEREQACAEGLALIKAPGSPMRPSATTYLTIGDEGRRETVRLRGSCCMYYKVPGGTNCSTCPLLKPPQREQRLLAWLRQSAASR